MEPDWHGCCAEEVKNEAKISMNWCLNFQQKCSFLTNYIFLVREELKLKKNMATLFVVLNCSLTRIRSNCEYDSGIIQQTSFFRHIFDESQQCRQNLE